MGKSFNNTAINTMAVVLAIVIALGAREAYPAYREAELFDLGYEHYLASQPEKALEAFTLFLKEFPQSSAKDAAMFWMGKSFVRMKQPQEARNIFDEMAREFPESPLRPYAIREIEKLAEAGMAKERESSLRGGTYKEETSHGKARQPREERVAEKPEEPFSQTTGPTAYMLQVAALDGEVKAFIDQYTQAYELGDIDKFMSFYSRSAVENSSSGYNEIRNGYQKNFQDRRYSYSLKDPLMEESDGNVILTGTYFITRTQGGPLGIVAQGHIRWTLTRENGIFKILRADYDLL